MRLGAMSLGVAVLLQTTAAWAAFSPKAVYKKAGPGVVLVLGADSSGRGSGGTGSIITREGKVITNAHVVIDTKTHKPYEQLFVFLKPNKITGDAKRDLVNRYRARVTAYSPAKELDLALLEIENAPSNLTIIPFADPDKIEIGEEVVAIGHPEQGGRWTLTTGTISTMIANFSGVNGKNVFQTEASVNRGNSGGPLLDGDGRMVGINTMIARQGAGGVTITDVNFSLKSSVAVKWLAGRGLGLAYAPRSDQEMTVAVAPSKSEKPAAASAKPEKVKEVPSDTIVMAEAPPKNTAQEVRKMQTEGADLGQKKRKEKVVAGKRLDPKKANPTYHTEKRPYDLDELRRQQIQELEDIMKDSRSKIRSKKDRGMGLW